jgi:hypothetical protein
MARKGSGPTVMFEVDGQHRSFKVKTYKEVKSNMKGYLEICDDEVSVFRHRRGEWGEWFENWQFNHERKPTIVKEGWM